MREDGCKILEKLDNNKYYDERKQYNKLSKTYILRLSSQLELS